MCKQTESLPDCLFYFSDKLWSLLHFFGSLSRSYIEQKLNKKVGGFPFVGWCMTNTASKNRNKIRQIERGIAKQRLCQHLSWPSWYSYLLQVGFEKRNLERKRNMELQQPRDGYSLLLLY